MAIAAIFESAFDLGHNYVDTEFGELDPHIEEVLDYAALGEYLVKSCGGCLRLSELS